MASQRDDYEANDIINIETDDSGNDENDARMMNLVNNAEETALI